jgi:hypothetical protein
MRGFKAGIAREAPTARILGVERGALDVHHRAIVANGRQAARRSASDSVIEAVNDGAVCPDAMDKCKLALNSLASVEAAA